MRKKWSRNDLGETDEGRREIRGEMQYLEGGWAYTGFCRAVHPAGVSLKFIKSSNVKREEGEGLTHLTACVRQRATQNAERQVEQLERANRSWLVREKSWQPKYFCVCVHVRFRLQVGRERRGGWQWMQCAQPANWLLNSDRAIPQDGEECEVTHKLRRGMPLENSRSHALHACVYVYVCRVRVCSLDDTVSLVYPVFKSQCNLVNIFNICDCLNVSVCVNK